MVSNLPLPSNTIRESSRLRTIGNCETACRKTGPSPVSFRSPHIVTLG